MTIVDIEDEPKFSTEDNIVVVQLEEMPLRLEVISDGIAVLIIKG